MTNDTYTYCKNQELLGDTSTYCKTTLFIGEIPERNTFIYDIAYYMYFIAFIIVVLSPIVILYKLINGKRCH